MVRFSNKGDFSRFQRFCNHLLRRDYLNILEKYGKAGVEALSSATPVDSGLTASSWGFEIKDEKGKVTIYWTNDHVEHGVNIAVILQYGHGTRNGGYVSGIDYINPAMRPIFDHIAQSAWREAIL